MYSCPLCESEDLNQEKLGEYLYYTCTNCSLGSVPQFGNEEEYLKNYYNGYHSNEEELNKLRVGQYEIDSDHLLSYLNSGKILDFGCSTGGFTKVLHRKGKFDLITGLDVDGNALNIARNELKSNSVEFLEGDFLNKDLGVLYDAVVFRGVFQYLSTDLIAVMEKVKSILKPGGYIFLYSMPNSESFVFNLKKHNWNLFNPIEHKLFFNENSIKYLSKKFDFKINELSFPYLETIYADVESDYQNVVKLIEKPDENKNLNPPFWGNILRVVLRHK